MLLESVIKFKYGLSEEVVFLTYFIASYYNQNHRLSMFIPNTSKNFGNLKNLELNDYSVKGNKIISNFKKPEIILGEVKEREDDKYTTQDWFGSNKSNW